MSANALLYEEVVKLVKAEQEEVMMSWNRFGIHNVNSLEQERKMWMEIMERGNFAI